MLGEFVTADNTGSDDPGQFTGSGRINATTPGTTREGLFIDGGIGIGASNLTFNNSYITGVSDTSGGALIWNDWSSPHSNISFNYCTLDGDYLCRLGAGAHDIHLYRCKIIRCKVDFQVYRDSSIVECYVPGDHMPVNDEDHREVVLCNSGERIDILGNNFTYESKQWVSAVVSLYGDSPGQVDVRCNDNYLNGGGLLNAPGYTIYAGATGMTTRVEVLRNKIGREVFRRGGASGPVGSKGSGATYAWAGNVWGAPGPFFVSGDPAEGTLIP